MILYQLYFLIYSLKYHGMILNINYSIFFIHYLLFREHNNIVTIIIKLPNTWSNKFR